MYLIFSSGKEVKIYDGQGPQKTSDFKKYNQNFNQIRSPFLFPPMVPQRIQFVEVTTTTNVYVVTLYI